jgi:DNA-binding NarL/FixJ family response regulator
MDRTTRIRVVLADDHMVFAETLAQLLNRHYEVVDVVGDGKALQASVETHRPDVAIVDVTMPIMSGLDSVRALRKDSNTPKIVFLTMHADPELARECFRSGASAFVTKESDFDDLVAGIDAALADRSYLSPTVGAPAEVLGDHSGSASPSRPEFDQLTSRQREILQLFAEGRTMKEIASLTHLSTRTVEWHKYRMMRILHVRRSAELVQHAVRMKLVL